VSTRVVAFLNFKGGVGKTSNVVNIGASLAQAHDKRVLIVDLDPQCNSSYWLLGKRRWREHASDRRRTVWQLFKDALAGTDRFRFEDAVVRGVPHSADGFALLQGLDLLPAEIDLMKLEQQMGAKDSSWHRVLREGLLAPSSVYDYVLLDCPPSFYTLAKNAVYFADHVAVPYVPDFLSLAGFRQLALLVDGFSRQVEGHHAAFGVTRLSAVIVNQYAKVGTVFQQGLLELERLVDKLRTAGLIHADTQVLTPPIRHSVQVAEAPALHLPISLHAPGSIGAVDYAALTRSFVRHYEELK
jgi:chromosome partitioning protein